MRSFIIPVVLALLLVLPLAAQSEPDIVIEARTDNSAPYVGEAMVYTLRIVSQEGPEALEDAVFLEPDFVGFGRSTYPMPSTARREIYEGATYFVTHVPFLLYPLRTGTLTIEPFQLELPAASGEGITLQTEPLTVTVQEFPEEAPPSFRNAVGQFDISSSLSTNQIEAGEALSYSLSVSGSGNIEILLAPELDFGAQWRIFDEEPTLQHESERFGTKTFRWTLIPLSPEITAVPTVAFSYFNPQSGRFETRRTAAQQLLVTGSAATTASPTQATEYMPPLVPTPLPLRPLPGATVLPALQPPTWFWALWLIPPLLVLVLRLVAGGRLGSDTARQRVPRRRIAQRPQTLLQSVETFASPYEAYQQIARSIETYISDRTGQHVTPESIQTHTPPLPQHLRAELLDCYEEAQSGQYAPLTQEDVRHLRQRVVNVLAAIDEVWK